MWAESREANINIWLVVEPPNPSEIKLILMVIHGVLDQLKLGEYLEIFQECKCRDVRNHIFSSNVFSEASPETTPSRLPNSLRRCSFMLPY